MQRAFEREARILAGLRHLALPGVTDFFGDEDGQYVVMQHIPGDDLAELLARRGAPFAPEQILTWADELLDALEYLHSRRPPILHRDIKPQNLKLTPSGEIVLLDFGLARGAEEYGSAGASLVAYTPQYAPIEQIRGGTPDVRSDIYALAATLHHLLTGELPPSAVARTRALLEGQPDPLRPAHKLNPAVPRAVGEALARAMAPLVEDRPASASALRDQLRAARPASAPFSIPLWHGLRATPGSGQPLTEAFPRTQIVGGAPAALPPERSGWRQLTARIGRGISRLRRRSSRALGVGHG
jgi:serine/threonine protein kinase